VGFLRQIFKREKKEQAAPAPLVETDTAAEEPVQYVDTPPPPTPSSDTLETDIETDESSTETTLISAKETETQATPWKAEHPFTYGYATHVGRTRRRNEDSALVLTSMTLGDHALMPFGLFVVADGMGGHSDGQKASQYSARMVACEVMNHIYSPFLQLDNGEPSKPIQDILRDSTQASNWQVHSMNPESGTTLTAVLVLGTRLYAAHVGDTRAYLITGNDTPPELLTVDHSFVQRLQDTGQITPEEASVHPQRNILYRAVGQGEKLDVDTFSRTIPQPSWLVICSDGLWGVVKPEFIQAVTTSAVTPQQACDELVEAALQAGGPDNITITIAHFGEWSPQPGHDTLINSS